MGSSKKRKEKREKKKHKRARSRSREHSHERDSYRRSHKSSQRDREKKYNKESHRDSDYEKVSDKKKTHEYHSDETERICIEDSFIPKDVGKNIISPLEQLKEYERPSSDEDFDPESLLDAKLFENTDLLVKSKSPRKRSPPRDSSEEGSNSERKRPRLECDDSSLERFAIENLEDHENFRSERAPDPPKRSGPKRKVPEAVFSLIREKLSKSKQSEEGRSKESNATSNSDVPSPSHTHKKIRIKEEPRTDVSENLYSREAEDGELGNDNTSSAQSSLSVNETNKLRAKLGLKPLQTTDAIPGLDSEEADKIQSLAKEVFVKTENISEKVKAEKLREKLKTMKEKRKITEKLRKVKGLGESDSEDDSAAAWVAKSRQLQIEKEKAEKRAKLLEEMDAEFGISALVEEEFEKKEKVYTSANLKGLTVAHSTDSIKEGQRIILTLKDNDVLNEGEDVLENVNMIDEERYAKNVENRKKKPVYKPYDEPEYDEFGILKTKNLLSKYDEEEKQPKSFKLGTENFGDKERELELIRMKLKQQQGISLEMTNMRVASEYYTQDEMVQFKKPKKKIRKLRKREILKADDLLAEENDTNSGDFGAGDDMEPEDLQVYDASMSRFSKPSPVVEDEVTVAPQEDLSRVVVEEDQAEKELHAALNKARKLKQRKAIVTGPEKIAEMMRNVENDETEMAVDSKGNAIVLNSTAEFCRTLGEIPTYGMSGNRDEEADELMDFERELMEENRRKETEAQNRGAWNEVHIDEEPAEILIKENEPILEEEPDIRFGVAGALALAQKKGYLDKDSKKQFATPRSSSLQAQSYTIEEKFYEDEKFGKRERYVGPVQDFREKANYKPDVKLEYIDDSGRLLSPKEAFRYLSHKFHGKGPGKNKVDKRMKKVDQETRLKQMSSTDTPLNTVKLLQAKQKEMQSPYIVLSGGSKTLTQTMISKKV